MSSSAQTVKGRIIEVTSDLNIDLKALKIAFSEMIGWHTTATPLFENGEIKETNFPTKAGLYNLLINYNQSLFYNELMLYRLNPDSEKLSFNFYKEGERIFCNVNSRFALELNKEIVLNELRDEMKEMVKASESEN